MDYYAGLDVSMEETHICVMDRDGVVVHETKVASTPADIDAALMEAPACRRRRIRDWPDGPDALSRAHPARRARGLHREPAGLSGAEVSCDPQDRSQ